MLCDADAEVAPDDLLREDAKLAGLHLLDGLRLPVLHNLPSILRVLLCVELEENGADEGCIAIPVLVLLCLDLGDDFSQMLAPVFDGVDLLSNQELQLVRRAVLGIEPSGTVLLRTLIALLAFGHLHTVEVRVAAELNFGGFELQGGLVPVLNHVGELLAVGGDPGVGDAGEHLEESILANVGGDAGEENGPRREAAGAPGRATVGLAEVDSVEGLSGDDDHDQR